MGCQVSQGGLQKWLDPSCQKLGITLEKSISKIEVGQKSITFCTPLLETGQPI